MYPHCMQKRINLPTFVKVETFVHVAPKLVDFQRPFPLLAPKKRMLLLFGSTAKRYGMRISTGVAEQCANRPDLAHSTSGHVAANL